MYRKSFLTTLHRQQFINLFTLHHPTLFDVPTPTAIALRTASESPALPAYRLPLFDTIGDLSSPSRSRQEVANSPCRSLEEASIGHFFPARLASTCFTPPSCLDPHSFASSHTQLIRTFGTGLTPCILHRFARFLSRRSRSSASCRLRRRSVAVDLGLLALAIVDHAKVQLELGGAQALGGTVSVREEGV